MTAPASPPDLDALRKEADAELAKRPDIICDRCKGKGYHHGFGEDGHDPDWCEVCGGAERWRPELSDVLFDMLAAERHRAERLQAEIDGRRMCVNCGRMAPADHPRHEPLPECVGPEGMAACTFDLTLDEAWQHWRQEAHAERQRAEQAEQREARLRAALEKLRSKPGCSIAVQSLIDAALAEGQE